ncbi:hypothetical protein ACWHLZ_27940 [Streptomyces chartreusis]
MIAELLASFAIAAVIVAWTFLATVRWARFGNDTPTRPTPTWARRNR